MSEVRVCEGFGILPYLQAKRLAYYYPMDAGRTQETSDKGLFLTAMAAARVSAFCMVHWAQIPMGQGEEGPVTPAHTVGCMTAEDPWAWGTQIFPIGQ